MNSVAPDLVGTSPMIRPSDLFRDCLGFYPALI